MAPPPAFQRIPSQSASRRKEHGRMKAAFFGGAERIEVGETEKPTRRDHQAERGGKRMPGGVVRGLLMLACLLGDVKGADVSFFDNPATTAARFEQAPTIDGALTDAAWASAQRLTPFGDYKTGKEAKHQTAVLAGFDRENLYLAFECREPGIANLKRTEIAHDSMALFAADHIEVFIKTVPAADVFYQFAVGAFGARYESKVQDASWSPKWRAATSVGKGMWFVEMAIPFRIIGEEVPKFLLANFCRQRRIVPGETSCWSPTYGVFHNPARFGSIMLGEGHPLSVSNALVSEVSRGKYRLSAVVKSSAEARKEIAAFVYTKPGKQLSRAARRQVVVGPDSSLTVNIPIEFKNAYAGPLELVFRDATTDEVLWFTGPQDFSLPGTDGLKVARALSDEASPALRWVETARLRACCYGFGIRSLPKLDLRPLVPELEQAPPHELIVKGESIIRVHVARGDKLEFRITALAASSLFSDSTYAVFDPEGKHITDGIVRQGEDRNVSIPAEQDGLHVVYLNSGPASDNSLSVKISNCFWIVDGRGKGAYFGTPVSLNSLRDLSLAGFNTVFLGSWNWGVDFSTEKGLNAWVRKVEQWVEAAGRYNMRLIPYVGWACAKNEARAAGEYRKTLSLREIDGPRPCPLSKEYWERTFLRRALAVARLSKKHPSIVGFGLDPESYHFGAWYRKESEKRKMKSPGWGSVVFFSNDECFCDHCFLGFLKSRGMPQPEVAADGKARFEWLKDKGLSKEYYKYLDDELCALTTALREKVHAVNPDFVFAVMLLGHTGASYHWWCSGASRGLGTPRLPAFDYDERTYTSGFTPAVERHKERYLQWGAHVVHGGTLWGGKHPPRDPHFLSAQMYHFAVRDSGYWFWPGNSSLWRNPDRLRNYYVLAGLQEDYWKAFVRANREIDRKLKQGDNYVSELDVLKKAPPTRNLDKVRGGNVWSEKPFYSLRVKSGTNLAFHVPKGNKRFTFICGLRDGTGEWSVVIASPARPISVRRLVSAEKGEKISIDVQPDEQGKAWTVQVEGAGGDGGEYLGIGLRGLPPFFSSCVSTLLVPETP